MIERIKRLFAEFDAVTNAMPEPMGFTLFTLAGFSVGFLVILVPTLLIILLGFNVIGVAFLAWVAVCIHVFIKQRKEMNDAKS